MGYYNIWGKERIQKNRVSLSSGLIFQNVERKGIFAGRISPVIHVEVISNLSKVYRSQRSGWWKRLIQKIGIL